MVEWSRGAHDRRRGPRPIAAAVVRLRGEKAPPTLLAKVQECWPRAVGEPVAAEATPVSERDGVVTVSCRSSVWGAELAMLSEELLGRLNRALPEHCQVGELRFVTRPS